jgi:hypothetical protein
MKIFAGQYGYATLKPVAKSKQGGNILWIL